MYYLNTIKVLYLVLKFMHYHKIEEISRVCYTNIFNLCYNYIIIDSICIMYADILN